MANRITRWILGFVIGCYGFAPVAAGNWPGGALPVSAAENAWAECLLGFPENDIAGLPGAEGFFSLASTGENSWPSQAMFCLASGNRQVISDTSLSGDGFPQLSLDTVRVEEEFPLISDFEVPSKITRIRLNQPAGSGGISSVLSRNSSIFSKRYGGEEGINTLSMRGLGAEHTLILLDGIPLNNSQLGSVNLSNLATPFFSEAEIYSGGHSSLYGSGAVGGAVNLSVNKMAGLNALARVSLGAFGLKKLGFALGLPTGKLQHTIQYQNTSSPNRYAFKLNGQSGRRQNSDFLRRTLDYLLTFRAREAQEFLFQVYSNENRHGVPNALFDDRAYQGRGGLSDAQFLTRMKWHIRESGFYEAVSQLYFKQNTIDYQNPDLVVNFAPLASHHVTREWGILSWHKFQWSVRLRSLLGVDAGYAGVQSTEVLDRTRKRFSVWGLTDWVVHRWGGTYLTLQAAFRQENYSDFGAVFLPRIGMKWAFPGGYFYSSWGRNYRAPTFNDLYWQPGGNPDLQAENSVSTDAGVQYAFRLLGKWKIRVDGYLIRLRNMIRWIPGQNGLWSVQNLGSISSSGLEADISYEVGGLPLRTEWHVKNGLARKTSADFPGDNTVGNRLPYLPRLEMNASVQVALRPVTLQLEWRYFSFRYSSLANSPEKYLPGVAIYNASLFYGLRLGNWRGKLFAQWDNLFRQEYQIIAGYPMPVFDWQAGFQLQVPIRKR